MLTNQAGVVGAADPVLAPGPVAFVGPGVTTQVYKTSVMTYISLSMWWTTSQTKGRGLTTNRGSLNLNVAKGASRGASRGEEDTHADWYSHRRAPDRAGRP